MVVSLKTKRWKVIFLNSAFELEYVKLNYACCIIRYFNRLIVLKRNIKGNQMQSFSCLPIFIFCLCGRIKPDIESYKFKKYANIRLESTLHADGAKSAIHCCKKCKETTECRSVSYNSGAGECLLSAISECYVTDDLVADESWTVYSETASPKPSPVPTTNLATDYKTVSQSSESGNYRPASQAVDGNVNSISHTDAEASPWWSMEFCDEVTIGRLIVWNRPDCCANQLSDIDITVDGVLCGSITTAVSKGGSTVVTCTTPLSGTVLKLQRMVSGPLNLAEVEIYSS